MTVADRFEDSDSFLVNSSLVTEYYCLKQDLSNKETKLLCNVSKG